MIRPKKQIEQLYRAPVPTESRLGKLRLEKHERVIGYNKLIVKKMLSLFTPEFISTYPEYHNLISKLARQLKVNPKNIIISAGSDGVIKLIFDVYVNKGDGALLLNPSFAMYEVYAKMQGAKIITVDFKPDLTVSIDEILKKINRGIKVIAIANPNNPTGTVIAEYDLLRIIKKAKANNALVLIDEAYYYFYNKSMIDHIKRFDNLIVTRTFSKAGGLAAARIGFGVAHPHIVSNLKKGQCIFEISGLAVRLAEFIVDNDSLVWNYVKDADIGKQYLIRKVKSIGFALRDTYSNFILIDCGGETGEIVNKLAHKGIIVASGLKIPGFENYIRVTTGPKKVMKLFLSKFKLAIK
ncbi:MAG: histidinol-phosphate aminotransferase family protein [Planctomycetes bacterium]|nr:histidinol-phosphate aminotransferase family protein [Planctomycetota bacterium]